MKKFDFPLQKVLEYRRQLLDVEKNELARVNLKLAELMMERQAILKKHDERQLGFEKEAKTGLLVQEYKKNQEYLWGLLREAERVFELIKNKRQQKEKQFKRVVKANQDVLILEKLREKKLQEYDKELLKQGERLTEEFVNNLRSDY